jgi:hypothetical protein|tara:strand:+ start:174 stop:461 length:288 start_codon:yes stop_codon:yes gene_type:complete
MYNEKVKVSKVATIVARMHNGVYSSQEEVMQEVLKVLCTDKQTMRMFSPNWSNTYHYSDTAFEENNSLLRSVGLERDKFGLVSKTSYVNKDQEAS